MRGFLVGFVVFGVLVGFLVLGDFVVFLGFGVGVFLGLIVCGLNVDCLTFVCVVALDVVF